jgi:hypothetical protein
MAFSSPTPPDVTHLCIKVPSGIVSSQRESRGQSSPGKEKECNFQNLLTPNSHSRSVPSLIGRPSFNICGVLPLRRTNQSHVVFAELASREPGVRWVLDTLSLDPVAGLSSPARACSTWENVGSWV